MKGVTWHVGIASVRPSKSGRNQSMPQQHWCTVHFQNICFGMQAACEKRGGTNFKEKNPELILEQ